MKHPLIAKRYWKDQSTPMGAVDGLARKYEGVIDLSLGDPDQTTHEGIIDFAFSEAKKGHTRYTDFRGDPELRAAIQDFYTEEFGAGVADGEIMVTTSACLGMYLSLEAILDPGDEVIIPAPYFTPYPQQVILAGGVPVELDTLESNGFALDLKDLEALVTERTRALIINSPNNPTGAVLTKAGLEGIVDLCLKHDLIVIADEIYGTYAFNEPFVSLITFERIRDRLIILNSFSKDYTMTGWRLGNIIAPPEIIRTCQLINENVVFTAPSISQRGAIYAIRHRHDIQPPAVRLYRERVVYAAERIRGISWMTVLPPKGTFYLFVNIKATGMTSARVSEILLEKARVLTIPGNAFGRCGEGYIRLACTVAIEKLKEAFDAIERISFDS